MPLLSAFYHVLPTPSPSKRVFRQFHPASIIVSATTAAL
jgi:hypothetical protein